MPGSPQLPFSFTVQNEFSFENFTVDANNKELLEALQSLGESEDNFYYLFGVSGAGKTHLLQSMNQLIEDSVYIPLSQVVEYGVEILAGLETLQLICLDDLESVAGNKEWEEALFQLFNAVRSKGHALLVSAKSAPAHLPLKLQDLQSRLSWGLTYELFELNDEEKKVALKNRAESRGIPLNDDVLQFILLRSDRGMHELFDALDQLDKLSLTEKRLITIPFVKEIMHW